jgi:hypothetical protein
LISLDIGRRPWRDETIFVIDLGKIPSTGDIGSREENFQ